MAVRLSVILVQTKPPSANGQRLTEEVVGELIGKPGIDLILVGPLSSLAEASTDRLTLDSLGGDVAVLDWQSPDEIVRGLGAINFQGLRSAHPHDVEADSVKPDEADVGIVGQVQRRVFAFDMSRFRDPGRLIEALAELNSRRQVRTFSIGIGAKEPRETAPKTDAMLPDAPREPVSLQKPDLSPKPSAQFPSAGRGNQSGSAAVSQTRREERSPDQNVAKPDQPDSATPEPTGSSKDRDQNVGGLDLDQLLDQLDALDP